MLNPILAEDLERIHGTLDPRALEDADIIVTGCAGFLGFYFLQYLVRYAEVLGVRRVLAMDNYLLGKPAWLESLHESYPRVLDVRRFDIARDDVASLEGVQDATHVVHMASIASPTFYRQYPIETLDANVWGLRRLFDFYRRSSRLCGFLFFSSSEIYGDPVAAAIPTDEEYRGNVSCVGPRACYDEAKRFGETMCQLFAAAHGMPVVVARPFNNYGPGMRLDDRRLPADFARSVIHREGIVIHSDGSPTRTFCYISDALSGYLKCLTYGKYDYFNIGIDKPEISVRDLAGIYREAAREIFGFELDVTFEPSKDADYLTDNPARRCPNIAKARRQLGYEPRVLVDEGVRRYLTFLKNEGAAA